MQTKKGRDLQIHLIGLRMIRLLPDAESNCTSKIIRVMVFVRELITFHRF